MKHWLCVTNEDNWRIISKKRTWGVSKYHKRTMLRVKPNDNLIFYLKKQGKIGGILKAISEPFESNSKIFNAVNGEIFPIRIKLEKVLIPKVPISFENLIPRLSFVRDKVRWGFYVWGAMRIIPRKDYKAIESALHF